jgi:hypothetical protein
MIYNELIAEFMGLRCTNKEYGLYRREDKSPHTLYLSDFPNNRQKNNVIAYDSSWDWLMPVVEKIEEMRFDIKINCIWAPKKGKEIKFITTGIWDQKDFQIVYQEAIPGVSKIQSVYSAVVEFIKWHNSQAPQADQ